MIKFLNPEKMPSSIVGPTHRQAVDDAIRKAVRSLQTAVKGLQKEDIQPTSATVEEWQQVKRNLAERRDKAWQHVKEDASLVDSEKAQRLAMWRGWYVTRVTYANTVLRILNEYPQAGWQFDEVVKNIVPTKSLDEIADEAATVEVPKEARDHAVYITAAREAIESLREWERQHHVSKLRLDQLFSLDEKELSTRWAMGTILSPDYNSLAFGGLISKGRQMVDEFIV